uniref:KIB1-4 beta-propeller domain-containing protein n=1 Tax=Leersia perrieri TaxID=77586 RepID=A0A0D9VA29_9ORYZ
MSAIAPCAAKRRRLAVTSAADSSPSSSPWASMNPDLLRLVAERALAGDLADYVRLRAVCPTWRSATACPRGRGGNGLHPGHRKLRGDIRFLNLSTGAIAGTKIPLFKDHMVLDSVDGLLLLHRDHDTAIRLLNPLTGDIVDLPQLETLRPQMDKNIYSGLWRRSEPKHRFDRVAFCTSGDLQWPLSKCDLGRRCWRPFSSQGKLFIVKTKPGSDSYSEILQIDPPNNQGVVEGSCLPGPELAPKLVVTFPKDKLFGPLYLAECDSEILLIGHESKPCSLCANYSLLPVAYNNSGNYAHISVYRISDLASGRFNPVDSIGDYSLFIGPRSISVSSKALPANFSGGGNIFYCSPTELFFTQYHLSSRTWTPFIDGSIGDSPPPRPYSLIHHILTCCYLQYWNKGLMFYRKTRPSWRAKRKYRNGVSLISDPLFSFLANTLVELSYS